MTSKCYALRGFLFLVVLQISLESTSASITKEDVISCISDTRANLEEQHTATRTSLDDIKKRKTSAAKEHMDKKHGNLNSSIQKEKKVIASFKQSAIEDNYNVSSCNDSSAIFNLILDSFGASSKAKLAEFQSILDRNYTQSTFLVNQFALFYQQLQKKLDACQANVTCFEAVQNECAKLTIEDTMDGLEGKFSGSAENFYQIFRNHTDNLYLDKSKEMMNYSQQLKDCFKSNLNRNDTNSNDVDNAAFRIEALNFLMILPVVYKIFV